MKHSNKLYFNIILSFLIGAFFLVIFSTIQKYILFNKVIFKLKGYFVPIIFGGIVGIVVYYLFYQKCLLNDKLRDENSILNKEREENIALYQQVEAYSQTIDSLNIDLKKSLNKYRILVESIKNINLYKSYSEKEFIEEIYEVVKKIVGKYDYSIAFLYKKGTVFPIKSKGYNIEELKKFGLKQSIVEKKYPKTDIYITENTSVKNNMTKKEKEKFNKINRNSKELMYLSLSFKEKTLGGIFLELKNDSDLKFTKEDLEIMKAFESIIKNYYQNIMYNKMKENQLIHIVEAMTTMLEIHDPYTKGHSYSVANISFKIGQFLNLSHKDLNKLYLAGLLHDIGKTFINYKILNKKGKLSNEEYELIKNHPSYANEILNNFSQFDKINKAILYHHERWDGTGYPDGLKKDEIPIFSQIICVADAYDAMISDRPYRKGLNINTALNELKENSGTQFSPKVVDCFLKNLKELEINIS
ncbi:MAG: HD-GYP domain-containing protein [Bacillota bacterium]